MGLAAHPRNEDGRFLKSVKTIAGKPLTVFNPYAAIPAIEKE